MQYEVMMTCKVTKRVICEGCTEEQARDEPFKYAVDEQELSMDDWAVDSVKRDE
jgi:hypothetical protein